MDSCCRYGTYPIQKSDSTVGEAAEAAVIRPNTGDLTTWFMSCEKLLQVCRYGTHLQEAPTS